MSSDPISSVIYDEKNPTFLKIREKFKEKLTTLFSCEDYDQIIKYIFDGVFKDKTPKKKCIVDFEPIFKDKTIQLMGFLWDLVEKTVNESKNNTEDQEDNHNENSISRNQNRNGNYSKTNKRMKIGNKEVILHNNRNRSRSNSNNKYNEEEYQGSQRNMYNQRGRYYNMMSLRGRGGYSFYPIMNPYIQRPLFYSKAKHPKPKEQLVEKTNAENAKTEEKDQQQQNEEKQTNENIIDTESFKKMSPEEQKLILEKREAKKKVRCKNWPNCKDPNCQYTHPKETCPFFPNCMFGDKCSYIHPNIPCKYGFYCTRIGCSYSHPAGWNPGMPMYPNVMLPIPHKGKKKHPVVNEEVKDNNNVEVSNEQKGEGENNVQVVQSEEQPPIQETNVGIQEDNQQGQ